MADGYLIRTVGGPHDGESRVVPRDMFGWPLPDELPLPESGGMYVKIRESQLPAEIDESEFVMRGAEYEWQAE